MTTTPHPTSVASKRLANRILAAVMVVQIFLFVTIIQSDVRALTSRDGWSRAQASGLAISGIDTHGYYAWLRSPLIDGDWHFANEYAFYQAHFPVNGALDATTPTGLPANHWSIGPALVWSAAVVPLHLTLTAAGVRGEEPCGFSVPYQLAVGVVTLALSLATLLFLYRIARQFAPPVPAAVAAGVVLLGTPLVAYGTVLPGMAHGPAAAALAGYVWIWLRSFGSSRPGRWFAVGFLLGVACLMRWQLVTFALLPALEFVWLARGKSIRARRLLALGTLSALGAVVGFIPQMIAWTVVYGRPIVNPHPTHPDWLAPDFWRVLLSADRGLFYWTPVTLFGTLGLLMATGPGCVRAAQSRILLGAVALQVYAMAALTDRGVYLGSSFGFRFLTETCVVLVVGLATVLRSAGPRWPTLLAVACGVAVCWNLLLVGVYNRCVPGAESGPVGLFAAVVRYANRRPIEALLLVVLAVAFTLRAQRGFLSLAVGSQSTGGESALGVSRLGLLGLFRLFRGLRHTLMR